MKDINIATRRTILNKIATGLSAGLAVGLSGVIIYSGIFGIKNLSRSHQFNKNASIVENAIKDKDYEKASEFVNGLELKAADKIDLVLKIREQQEAERSRVKKAEGISRLEASLELYGAIKSYEVLNELRDSRLYDKNELSKLERKVYDSTLPGISSRLYPAKVGEKSQIYEEYLRLYPRGTKRTTFINGLISENIDMLYKFFDKKESYQNVNSQIDKLNFLFERFSDEKIYVNDGKTKDLFKKSIDYIDDVFNTSEKITRGNIVKVDNFNFNIEDWKGFIWMQDAKAYLKERNEHFEIGSVGKVIYIREYGNEANEYVNEAIVEFEKAKDKKWSVNRLYQLGYWAYKNMYKEAAVYKLSELKNIRQDDPGRDIFKRKIKILEENFRRYKK